MTPLEAWEYLHEFVDEIPSEGLDNWLNWMNRREFSTDEIAIDMVTSFKLLKML